MRCAPVSERAKACKKQRAPRNKDLWKICERSVEDLWKICGRSSEGFWKAWKALRSHYEWAYTSPATSPAGAVSSTGALDAGTTPVFSMSGPAGPPVTYSPPGAIGATGPGVDPLQGAGDPWGHGQQV